MEKPLLNFSLLIPTRGRVQIVQRLFQSIVDTAADLDQIEIVLGIDDDDTESAAIEHERLKIVKTICPKGLMRGLVSKACFEASSGRFLVQVADDVVMRTPHWDSILRAVFSMFPDDIALLHCNDLLFREKLCTFPVVSRRACQAIGVCPTIYKRYRNDDHIYDTYNLLALLGYKRIVYLEDVIFEHKHYVTDLGAHAGGYFQSQDNKFYIANEEDLAYDAKVFDEHIDDRKRDALTLARLIDEHRCTRLERRETAELRQFDAERRTPLYGGLLEGVRDAHHYRRPDFLRRLPPFSSMRTPRTTVLVVTADARRDYAQRCLSLLKEHTANFDLMVLDNNGGGDFAHSREMNRALRAVETEYLVLMDDDVHVQAGWLDRLFAHMDDTTAVVSPMHLDARGEINYSGAYLAGDGRGTHAHHTDPLAAPREIQCVCTACLLIDVRKVGHVFMDEIYNKYFFDLAYGLRVWEEGFRCVCAHDSVVTHLGGATMIRGTGEATGLWERDRGVFIEDWVRSGRLARLETGIWQRYPFMKKLVDVPRGVNDLFDALYTLPPAAIKSRIADFLAMSRDFPLFRGLIEERLCKCIPGLERAGDRERAVLCHAVLRWMNGALRPAAQVDAASGSRS